MSTKNPTLVFIHGAWHDADCWEKVTVLLEAKQFKCVAVSLPSNTGNPSISYGDDIRAAQGAILAETSQGNEVVLVVHSYGSAVGQSAIKGLNGILGICMIAGFLAVTGQSMIEAMGGTPPPLWKDDPESGLSILQFPAQEVFYHDLPPTEADSWALKLRPQHRNVLYGGGECSYAGWMDVPIWDLLAVNDRALPVELQRMFFKSALDAGADFTAREIESGHFPMLSHPKETVNFLLEAVEAMLQKKKVVVTETTA